MLSIIVAMDRNGLIGTDEGLPWHLSADLKRFRRLTMGKPIVMGRTTHEQIGRVLDGRTNIVLTRDESYQSDGCVICHSLDEALRTDADEVMIIGGSQIYREAFSRCERLYLTVVEGELEGTVYFPADLLDRACWEIVEEESFSADEKNPLAHQFLTLNRAPSEEAQSLSNLLRR